MSSYSEAFNTCGARNNVKKPLKPRIFENYRPIPQTKQVSQDTTKTTHSQLMEAPSKVIQDNSVNFSLQNNHSWSNSRGYGNIVIGTYDSCSNIHGRVHPYNRIPKLPSGNNSVEQ